MSAEYDIRILDTVGNSVNLAFEGKSPDSQEMLFQRIWMLLLSGDSAYRGLNKVNLLGMLDGKNIVQDKAIDSVLSIACASVLRQLDDSDRNQIASLTGEYRDGGITVTLTLRDGVKLSGVFKHDNL